MSQSGSLEAFVSRLSVDDARKAQISDALDGFSLEDIRDLAQEDLVDAGLDAEAAAAVMKGLAGRGDETKQGVDDTPIREWNSETVAEFMKQLPFLNSKPRLLAKALASVTQHGLSGEVLVQAPVDGLKEVLEIPKLHAKKLVQKVQQRVKEEAKSQAPDEDAENITEGKGGVTPEEGAATANSQAEKPRTRIEDTKEAEEEEKGEEEKDDRTGVLVCPLIEKKDISGMWKTILVVGETGTGKSTTLNSLVNFLMDVKYGNNFRYKLIVEDRAKDQSQSVTDLVSEYHINCAAKLGYGLTVVDTPGFGDSRGLKQDQKIMKQIEDCFRNRVPELNAVCFTIRAGCARLTPSQKYVYGKILGLFGNDIAKNLFMLITFCDGKTPPAMAAIKKANIPYVKCIELNNSAFFNGFDEVIEDEALKNGADEDSESESETDVSAMFWDMGMKAFNRFFKYVSRVPTTSLVMTKEVLKERENLELCIVAITNQIQLGLNTLEYIREGMKQARDHERDINANANFKITVNKPDIKQERCPPNVYTTTCRVCNWTCHKYCAIPNDDDKAGCAAMSGGSCTACPRKCHWRQHSNLPYWIEHRTIPVTEEVLSKREALEAAAEGMCNTEAFLIKKRKEFIDTQDKVYFNIGRVRSIQQRLQQIALRPEVIAEEDHFDMMIEAQKTEAKEGWRHRVKAIEELKVRARHLREITQGDCSRQWEKMSRELQQIDRNIAEVRRRAQSKAVDTGMWQRFRNKVGI